MNPVISVRGLGKKYRIGIKRHDTLRDQIASTFRSLFRRNDNPHAPSTMHHAHSDEFWALRDVSFDVQQGEVIGIIGRNGAGKSTLLKILSQITEPTTGEITVRGRVASLLEVGTGFHPELTGQENIFLNGAILGMSRAEIKRKFDEIVAFSEIEKFIDTPVKHYSSGMYVRLAFAVAAHLEPEILIVDEVLAVGDAAFQKKCLGKMRDVSKGGRTVLFVSHNMNAIQQLCRKALLLENGRLQAISSDVRELTTKYLFGEGDDHIHSEWINPGGLYSSPYFQPTRFSICNDDGSPLKMPISNSENAWIRIEGKIEVIDPALTLGYAIFADTGDLLYWSYQTDVAEDNWPKLECGVCRLQSRFPRRLLNQGTYRIELITSLHYRKWLLEPGVNAPSMFLIIQGGLSDSPYWMNRRPGLLAPVNKWYKVS